jgi:hypothetical protein
MKLGIRVAACLAVMLFIFAGVMAEPAEKAGRPILLTSCGQSPGPVKIQVFLKKLQMEFVYAPLATAKDLATQKSTGAPFQSLIVVSGASLKGMGAAGVSIGDEIARTKALIAEAQKQGIKVIAAHIEGMSRRAQGAAEGDQTDEQSIDAVCPLSALMIIRKDGNEDGRFAAISKNMKIPMLEFVKNLDLEKVLADLFSK